MTTDEIRQFFRAAPAQITGNPWLREPQLEGYEAVLRHFAARREHAILRIPVGCGKLVSWASLYGNIVYVDSILVPKSVLMISKSKTDFFPGKSS